MPRWRKTGKWKRATIGRLLKRDGADCWLCALPLKNPPKKPNKRISLEHLNPRSLGGDDSDANLVLCHQHCNKHLGDRPPEKKLAIRSKWVKRAEALTKRKRSGKRRPAGQPSAARTIAPQ